ncbi:multiple inositol polyphosphate phosphatase 1-like [Oratosquilla oratoria]|uniref:multiple inositol polyphosphate phosphatase 1-like n=1 Tax=Oratosquilla oratoria TaxID=337810 RepID=UPI003F76AE09
MTSTRSCVLALALTLALVAPARPCLSGRGSRKTSEPYCLANDKDPYVKFSTKTSYSSVRGDLSPEDLVPSGCTAAQIWLLNRHGTRYPGTGDIETMKVFLPLLKGKILVADFLGQGDLCEADVAALANWSVGHLNETWNNVLAPEGEEELRDIALRLKSILPDLLQKPFDNATYSFRHTKTQRTERSARSFAKGLFGDEDGETVYMPAPIDKDPLLRFYKRCKKYQTEVDDNPEAVKEMIWFEEGPLMDEVILRVSKRLGIVVTFVEMRTMYTACRYYTSWNPKEMSPWCAAFTHRDLQILEYWQDLKGFYEDGYGHAINYEQACPPLKDLLEHFRDVISGGETTKAVLYFSHQGALMKVYSALGLWKDDTPITHETDPFSSRLWSSSDQSPFASNLAFVLSRCGPEGDWVVTLAQQEKLVTMPGCGKIHCPWEDFFRQYGHHLYCPFDEICENNSTRIRTEGLESHGLTYTVV